MEIKLTYDVAGFLKALEQAVESINDSEERAEEK